MVKHINSEEFQKEVIDCGGTVLVDFFATWCGPCQMLSPVLEKIVEERTDLKVVKVDIDQNTKLAIDKGIEVVPTVIIYKDGKQVDKFEGFMDKEEIIDVINNIK